MPQTFTNAIAWWSRMRPEQPALVLGDDRLTYKQLNAWSERIAEHLIREGVVPGDRIGICSTNSLVYCALLVGIIRAGGICNPINYRYTAREIRDLVEATEPRFVFALPEYEANVREASCEVRSMADLLNLREGDAARVSHDPQPDDRIVIIATSGSTAKPKGVVFTHRSVTGYATSWAAEEPTTPPRFPRHRTGTVQHVSRICTIH